MEGCFTAYSVTAGVRSGDTGKKFKHPVGSPAAVRARTTRCWLFGENSEGLSITVLPHTSGVAIARAVRFTWNQRFWVSDRHYVSGGPVFVLDGGEDTGEDRLPYLDTGIVDILTNATGGLGIVLEHRYYGESVPVLNFTTDSLR